MTVLQQRLARWAAAEAAFARGPRARKLLSPPPLPDGWANLTQQQLEAATAGFGQWWAARAWPGLTETGDQTEAEVAAGRRLLTHCLSYPLTLARFVHALLPAPGEVPLEVAVVGARAEAALPLKWWAESLLATRRSLNCTFVGPEVPSRPPAEVRLPEIGLAADFEWRPGAWHPEDDAQRPLDLVWFSNPGFGHPDLHDGWKASVRGLPPSCLCFVTSHHAADQQADFDCVGAWLGDLVEVALLQGNPLRSGKAAFDPYTGGVAHANCRAFAFRVPGTAPPPPA